MPHPCCVPGCNGNYKTGPKVRVYGFPKDPELHRKWIRAIKRDNFVPTKHSKVCERHFQECDFKKTIEGCDEKTGKVISAPLQVHRLVSGAIPSLLPNLPDYFSCQMPTSRETPESRMEKKEMESIRIAIVESVKAKEKYDQSRTFVSLTELCDKLNFLEDPHWTVLKTENCVSFLNINVLPTPKINYSVVLNSKLEVTVFLENIELKSIKNFTLPLIVNNINNLNEILDELKLSGSCSTGKVFQTKCAINLILNMFKSLEGQKNVNIEILNFLSEQVSFLGTDKHAFRYSAEMMVFSSLLFTIAPCAYRFIRRSGNLILPHPNSIRRVCLKYNVSPQIEQLDTNFLFYIRQKFKFLEDKDKKVLLLLDEVHVKEYFDYKGGSIVGMSYDAKNCASSAQVFMIKSIISDFKDVVHVLPVSRINGEILYQFVKKIIIGLEDIGFFVICVITDNNSVNRNAISHFVSPPKLQFVYPHPVDNTRPLFFLVDTVHLLKCARNNWLNQKNYGRCFFYPKFDAPIDTKVEKNFKTASFSTIQDLHSLESNNLIKYGFKLSLKALSPSSMEKQNVKLVLQIFNEFVAQGLIQLGEKHDLIHFQDTSDFITLIITWWQIVNVKSPNKGFRLNNDFQKPLTLQETDKKFIFLTKFVDWLDTWHAMKCTTGMFTRETHTGFKLSTECILQITDYCTNELKLKYILPGKFQTDDLESRFGCYRQLAGCQYNISTQQLFEGEKKLRMQSLLYLNIPTKSCGEVKVTNFEIDTNFHDFDKVDHAMLSAVKVLPADILGVNSYLPVIIYLAGYCAFSALKKDGCKLCKEMHLLDKQLDLSIEYNFVKNLDRGGLSFPKKHVINAVLYNYVVVKKLCYDLESDFIKQQNQKHVITTITTSILEEKNLLGDDDVCSEGHSVEKFLKLVIWSSTNIFLNNYTKMKNDSIAKALAEKTKNLANKKAEKRKENTLKISDKIVKEVENKNSKNTVFSTGKKSLSAKDQMKKRVSKNNLKHHALPSNNKILVKKNAVKSSKGNENNDLIKASKVNRKPMEKTTSPKENNKNDSLKTSENCLSISIPNNLVESDLDLDSVDWDFFSS